MDTALPQKFPFTLDRNLANANCTGNQVCTSCDKVVLGKTIFSRIFTSNVNVSIFSFTTMDYIITLLRALNGSLPFDCYPVKCLRKFIIDCFCITSTATYTPVSTFFQINEGFLCRQTEIDTVFGSSRFKQIMIIIILLESVKS